MGSVHGFRPPQFSEDAAWLPTWFQQCGFERFKVDGAEEDHVTLEQRIEELRILGMNINNSKSSREWGGCKIGQLCLTGTENSPFSYAQSADNVVTYHLHLSLDGDSDYSTPITNIVETESNCHFEMLPLYNSKIIGRETINPREFYNSCAIESSPKVELGGHPNQDGLLKCEENVKFSEYFVDTVELCIAASETLVINDVIKNDSSVKPSASSILEASIQMKQARSEVCKNTFCGSLDKISDIDKLSDLDDIAMGSAYEDAGIHLDKLHEIELSASQVKDTLDSNYDEKTGASATDCGTNDDSSTQDMRGGVANDAQLTNNLVVKCFDGDKKKGVTENLSFGLGIEDVGLHNDCLKRTQASEEVTHAVMYENNLLEKDVGFSLNKRFDKTAEKGDNSLDKIQERFRSRWLGGWTWKNGANCCTAAKHIIAKPFVDETSFFSESEDVAPDNNSFVQNHDKRTTITSQLSVPSESFSNRAMEGITPSQDVKSSSASFLDPLCSVVPCSISESICSLPATNQDDAVFPGYCNILTDHTKGNLLGPSASNSDLPQGEGTAMQISTINEPHDTVCRRFTSLRNYSTLFSRGATFLKKESHQERSLWNDSNAELIFQETSFTNCGNSVKGGVELMKEKYSPVPPIVNHMTHYHQATIYPVYDLGEENQSLACPELQKDNVKLPTSEVPNWELLKCKNLSDQHHPASKRVHFLEKETDIQNIDKKVQSKAKICLFTKAAKKLTESGYHGSRYLNISRKNHLDKTKRRLIFRHMEFMLTGFSCVKEKEIEGLIRKHGGTVVNHIPSTTSKGKRSSRFKSQVLPIILCLKKIQSVKFLYGCAVNALILRVNWLMDSVAAGFVLPKEKYMILSRNIGRWHSQINAAVSSNSHSLIFNNVGIMLHGKSKSLINMSTIIKHGGGQVFNTLQRLTQNLEAGRIQIGVVVAEYENHASRHLKQCALENNVSMMSICWIIRSLYAGQLIPVKEKRNAKCLPAIKMHLLHNPIELSPEI